MRKSRNWWCGWFREFFFRYSSSDTSASTSISFPESFATCFGDLLDSLHIFKIQIATNVNLYPDVNNKYLLNSLFHSLAQVRTKA